MSSTFEWDEKLPASETDRRPDSGLAATVVIPARNAEGTVAEAVRAVREQRDRAGRPVEVVVVDDGSEDGTAEAARAAGARVLALSPAGPARARNVGVSDARSEIVIFTDADCSAMPGFVELILGPFADARVSGVKGAYLTQQRSLVACFVQQEYQERYRRMARRDSIDFIDTYAAAYRRSALEAVGGFDERYLLPSTEDQDLSFRVAATGARLVFQPEARVAHLHAASLGAYFRKKLKIGRFKIATLRSHPTKVVDDAHTTVSLKLQILLLPFTVLGLMVLPIAGSWPSALGVVSILPSALFLVTTLPLTTFSLREDPLVGLLVPFLAVVRAAALTLGMARGLLAELGGGVLSAAGDGKNDNLQRRSPPRKTDR